MNSRHKKLIVIGAAVVLLVLCLFVFGGRAKKQDDRALSDYSEEVTTEAEVASESQAELNADMEMLQEAMEEDMASLSDASNDTATVSDATPTDVTEEAYIKSKYDIRIKDIMEDMSLNQKVAQMFIITPETLTGYSAVYKAENVTKQAYASKPVGGLIYKKPNLMSESQTRTMLLNTINYSEDIAGVPAFLCIDEQGDEVNMILESKNFDTEEIDIENKTEIGDYLWSLGFNVEFGAIITAEKLTDSKLSGVFKHFPGGMSKGEISSYNRAIKENKGMIMVTNEPVEGYTGEEPACLTEEIVTIVLRRDMNYKGVVITDSLSDNNVKSKYSAAQAATMAVNAGADMIYLPSDYNSAYNAIISAVKNGDISEERIDESVYRILDAKLNMSPAPSNE